MPTKSSQRGFTLIEVMVVVAIVGITSSLALVYIDSGKKGRTVEGYAESLAAQFSVAHQRAIASQSRQRLVIEADGFSHWQSVQTGLAQVADPSDPANWVYVFEKTTPLEVTIVATNNQLFVNPGVGDPAAGVTEIEIDILPDGRARSAVGGTFFEAGWTVFIQDDDGKQVRVALFGLTGTASVYDGW